MSKDVRGYAFMGGANLNPSWIDKLPDDSEDVNVENLRLFFQTMFERQEIWHRRNKLKLPQDQWTNNEIFKEFKFTNVYRVLDRASQWLVKNVYNQNDISVKDLIWRIMFFRFFNQPDTFDHPEFGIDLPAYNEFDPEKTWEQVVTYRENVSDPFHHAYLINLAFAKKPSDWSGRGLFKDEAYIKIAYVKMHKSIPKIAATLIKAKTPLEIIMELEKLNAVSKFQSYEFFLDFGYAAKYWHKAIMRFDENDYTNVGPGASLGLRMIFPSLKPKEQIQGLYWLRDLSQEVLKEFGDFNYIMWNRQFQEYTIYSGIGKLSLHPMEMWCCELSKYFKILWKEGKQRSKFIPKTL